jgi:nucleoside-diphosphate-sugar epimerase
VAVAISRAAVRLDKSLATSFETFNISSGHAPSMKQLADQVIREVGSGRHRPGPQSNQSFSLYTRIDRAKQDLGFEPRVGTEDMIRRLIHHFKETHLYGPPSNDNGHHHHQRASIA